MNTIRGLSRLGVMLASLAVIAVTFASGASASTGMLPLPGPDNGPAGAPAPVTLVRTVVVGGMPGWQIASIAVAAALVAAIAAVLVGRTRTARRRPVRPLADPFL